jgi:hypothetical protein
MATSPTFASLSGPDFVRMDRRQIKALSLDELQGLCCAASACWPWRCSSRHMHSSCVRG